MKKLSCVVSSGVAPDPSVSDPKASGTVSSGMLVVALAEIEPGSVKWQGGIETAARFAAEHEHRFECRAPA